MNTLLVIGLLLLAFLAGRYVLANRNKAEEEISDETANKAFKVIEGKTIGLFHNSYSQAARAIFYELRMLSPLKGIAISDSMTDVNAIVYISEGERNQVKVTITAPMAGEQPAWGYKIDKILPSSNPINAVLIVWVKLAEFLEKSPKK